MTVDPAGGSPALEPVRVEVRRSGGFAGLTTSAELDTRTLPGEQADELRQLLAQADVAGLASRLAAEPPGPGRGADRFSYDLTVQQGEQRWELSLPESAVPPELSPLLTHVVRSRTR